jgi:hypothetical protein
MHSYAGSPGHDPDGFARSVHFHLPQNAGNFLVIIQKEKFYKPDNCPVFSTPMSITSENDCCLLTCRKKKPEALSISVLLS